MKNGFLLLLAVSLLLLQTGCAGVNESPYLSAGTIRTSFDSVRVRISKPDNTLIVTVRDDHHDLSALRVTQASASTWTNIVHLRLKQTVYDPANPHQMDLVFTPAPQPPFSINLTATVEHATLFLQADYYGPHKITF